MLLVSACSETGKLSGTVAEDNTAEPIRNALVLIERTELHDSTDNIGRYAIRGIPEGWYYASARAEGYRGETLLVAIVKTSGTLGYFSLKPAGDRK